MQSWPPPPSLEQEEAGIIHVCHRVRLHVHFRSPCLSVLPWLRIDLHTNSFRARDTSVKKYNQRRNKRTKNDILKYI